MTPTWWLGPVGAMQTIRPPARGYDRSGSDRATVVGLLSGQAVQRSPRVCRQWQYQWVWMTRPDWSVVAGIRSGQYGPGPYALIDPAAVNLLTPNQAAAGAPRRSTDGYTTDTVLDGYAGPPLLAVAAAPVQQGNRSVSWALPAPADLTPSYNGSISQGETKTHPLTVPAGVDTLTIDLSDGADDLDLYLYRDGEQLAFSGSAGSTEQIVVQDPSMGEYEIRVEAFIVATTAAYTVSVTMTVPTPATQATLTLPHPMVDAGWPTPPAVSWTLSAWMQATTAVDATVALVWRDASGANLSGSTATIAVGTSGWTRCAVTGTAPSEAVTVGVELRTLLGSATTVYVGAARLAVDDNGDDWWPGEGLPMVTIVDMTETVPVYDRRTVSMRLAEVTG